MKSDKNNLPALPSLLCVDAGAMNGFNELKGLHQLVNLYSFEPDEESYNVLINKIYPKNNFASYKAENIALHETNGEYAFYYTGNPGMNSMLEPDLKQFELIFGSAPGSLFWKEQLTQKKKGLVKTIKLDDYCLANNIKNIDFFKLDTQGTEKHILLGASNLLKENVISIIKTEISLLTVYKLQNSFSDIDTLLKRFNYKLIDCEFYPNQVYDVGASYVSYKNGLTEKTRLFPVGDAIYVKEPELLSVDMRYRAAFILTQMGYIGVAKVMLCTDNVYSEEDALELILQWKPQKKRKKITQLIKVLCPPLLYKLIKRFGQNSFK